MKKMLLILFLFLSSNLLAQDFAPVGAKWYYTHYDGAIPSSVFTSYNVVESVADTIINTLNCSKLKVTINNYQNQYSIYWFMRSDSDKIFYFSIDSSRFLVLYDFTKQVGDSFYVEGYYAGGGGFPLVAYVDTIGIATINGHGLKFFEAHTNDQLQYSDWGGYETIGSFQWMFPQGDNYLNGPLRCYSDTSIGLYETGEAFSCDWNTAVTEINFSNQSVEISPNPSSGIFNLQFQNSSLVKSIDVITIFGKKIFSSNRISDAQFVLNLSAQPSGIYFLKLKTETGIQNKIIVINK